MRSRRHQERLEKYYKVVNDTILKHQVSEFRVFVRLQRLILRFQWSICLQDLHTGLIASSASSSDAWIRDNVYCISAVWALASAYKAASDQSEDMIKVRWLRNIFVWSVFTLKINFQHLQGSRSVPRYFALQTYHLEQNVVRCMRGLLLCMMRQSDRLERFKNTSDPKDSLHAKFAVKTGRQGGFFFLPVICCLYRESRDHPI